MHNPKYEWWYNAPRPPAAGRWSRAGRVLLQTICALAGAGLFFFKFHLVWLAGLLAGIGLLVLISGLLIPRLYAAFEQTINFLAFGVGQVLTWLLLAPFYYACMLPARLILLCAGRDPMKRKWAPEQSTYWEEKRGQEGHNRLTSQY